MLTNFDLIIKHTTTDRRTDLAACWLLSASRHAAHNCPTFVVSRSNSSDATQQNRCRATATKLIITKLKRSHL